MNFELSAEQAALVARASAAIDGLPSDANVRALIAALAAERLLEGLSDDPVCSLHVSARTSELDAGLGLGLGAHLLCLGALAPGSPLRGEFTRAEKIGCVEPASGLLPLAGGAKGENAFISRVIGAVHADYILGSAPSAGPEARLLAVDLTHSDITRRACHLAGLANAGLADLTFASARPVSEVQSAASAAPLGSGLDLTVAAAAIGLTRATLAACVAHLERTGARGGPGSTHQAEEFAASDIATELEAAWLSAQAAALRRKGRQAHASEAASARWLSTEAATDSVHRAAQVLGEISSELGQWQLDAQLLTVIRGPSFDALETIASHTLGET